MAFWKKHNKLRYLLSFAALLLVTYLYHPTLEYAFLDGWDDPQYVTENPKIRSLSLGNVARIFTSFDMGNYAPLHIMSYALEYQLWGMDPFGYRLVNLALHFLNAFLVFFVVRKICERDVIAFVVTLLFLVHPLQVETVAWISQRKTLLSTFFMLTSFIFFMKYREGERPANHTASLVFYVMALLSKISVIALPVYMLAYDFLVSKELNKRRLVQDYLMFAIASIVMVLITLMAQGLGVGIRTSHYGPGILESLSVPPALWSTYVQMICCPTRLSALYDEHVILQSIFVKALIFALVFGGIVVFLIRRNTDTSKIQLFWITWFIVGLLPVSHIIPVVTVMNDRYVYFPMIGLAAFASTALYEMVVSRKGSLRIAMTVIVSLTLLTAVGAYTWTTKTRVPAWENSYELWSDAVKKYPKQAKAHNNLGAAFEAQWNLDEAKLQYLNALDINPDLFVARYNLGKIYGQKQQYDAAAIEFQKAADILPMDPKIHYLLAMAYKMDGHPALAIEEFKKDLQITPSKMISKKELLELYVTTGQKDDAKSLIVEMRERYGQQHPVEEFLRTMEKRIRTDSRVDGA